MIPAFLNSERAMAMVRYSNMDKYNLTGAGRVVFLDDIRDHVPTVYNTIRNFLPEATIIAGSMGFNIDGDTVTGCNLSRFDTGERLPFDEAITKWGIQYINNSKQGSYEGKMTAKSAYMKDKIERYNLIMTASAGNGYTVTSDWVGSAIIVSQVVVVDGKVQYANDACGSEVDFVNFPGYGNGTSFAAPWMLAEIMIADILYEKRGKMNQAHAYRVFKNICQDLCPATA